MSKKECYVIQVTPRVVERLQNVQRSGRTKPALQISNQSTNLTETGAPKTEMPNLAELQEEQFEETMKKMDAVLGKPVYLQSEKPKDLLKIRQDIEKCYKCYPKESLHCSELAKQFQRTVFDHQMQTIFKSQGIEFQEPN